MKAIFEVLDKLEADPDSNAPEIDRLLKELDEVVAPVRKRAEQLGYLMTPVIVVNDKVKSAGYVPALDEIREWVFSETRG